MSWALLTTGEHEYARKAFDECYYRSMTTRETQNDYEQGANIRSNDALHRLALGASHDELRGIWMDSHFQENHLESKFYPIVLDHIDGNKSNNAIENLRPATNAQNAANRGALKTNKLSLKGVCRERGKYKANIKINGRNCHIGYFNNPEDAYVAYCKKANEVFGEFAWTSNSSNI